MHAGFLRPPTATAGVTSGNDPFTHPIQAVDPGKMLERRKTHRAAGIVRALSIVRQTLTATVCSMFLALPIIAEENQ